MSKVSSEVSAPAENPTARTPPVIDPSSLTVQYDGAVYKEVVVRLPKDCVFGDLVVEPSIWKQVQSSPKLLCKLDRVHLIAFDESWVADAVVAGATHLAVMLSKPVKIELQA